PPVVPSAPLPARAPASFLRLTATVRTEPCSLSLHDALPIWVTVLARGVSAGVPHGVGWARLCRLVSEVHLTGEVHLADEPAQPSPPHTVRDPRRDPPGEHRHPDRKSVV